MSKTLPMKNKPEPCPNCGSTDIWMNCFSSLTENEGKISFHCKNCGFSIEVTDQEIDKEFNFINSVSWERVNQPRAAWIEVWNIFVIERAHHNFKPCPFCGSDRIAIDFKEEYTDEDNYKIPAEYTVYCCSCGATRGSDNSLKDAKERWNYRKTGNV